jgi:hypothetical protein
MAARTVAAAMLVAALVGWWAAPPPPEPQALVQPRRDAWSLAAVPRQTDQATTAALVVGASYWGRSAAPPSGSAAPPAADPRWRIAAIYGVGADRGVLVQYADASKPAARLKVGDALPSGHRIVEINPREVCVRIGGKTFRLGVERSDS